MQKKRKSIIYIILQCFMAATQILFGFLIYNKLLTMSYSTRVN